MVACQWNKSSPTGPAEQSAWCKEIRNNTISDLAASAAKALATRDVATRAHLKALHCTAVYSARRLRPALADYVLAGGSFFKSSSSFIILFDAMSAVC